MSRPTILVTAVGSMVGQAILDSLEGRRTSVRLVGCNSEAGSPNNFRCDRSRLVPATSEPGYAEALLRVCREEEAELVIPCRDADAERLAELAEADDGFRGVFLGGSARMARMMGDKGETARFGLRHGLPFADTVETGTNRAAADASALRERHGFPLILKPRDGYSSRGVRVVTTDEQLRAAATRPGLLLQPFLDPPPELSFSPADGVPLFWQIPDDRQFGAQVLIGRDGADLATCAFRATMVMGRCERLERVRDRSLLDVAEAFAGAVAAEGWRGPFNVQARRDRDGGWRVIELNGRFSGGTSARRHVGFDEVALTVNEWLGAPLIPPDPGVSEVVSRQLMDRVIDAAAVERLGRTATWTSS